MLRTCISLQAVPHLGEAISRQIRVAFGPRMPDWGSWEWVGQDVQAALAPWYRTSAFEWNEIPECDVLCVIKHPLPVSIWRCIPATTQIAFAPVDHYGSAGEIDADGAWLRRCSRIVVHCEKLSRYFSHYAPVEYLDHHVKYVTPTAMEYRNDGPILWVGVRSNMTPLSEWLRQNPLPRELVVLTNPENATAPLNPGMFGLPVDQSIRVETWNPERHLFWLTRASAALDIKGDDFRSRHKPPAKAMDFLASGLPLAMNSDSSSTEHLARMGFELAVPEDPERWLSHAYWEETQRLGAALRELLSRERIGLRWRRVIEQLRQSRSSQEPSVIAASESVVPA